MALFGKKADKQQENPDVYMLMDSSSHMLARGIRLPSPGQQLVLFIRLTEGDLQQVVAAGIVQAVPLDKSQPSQMTRVIDSRANAVALAPMRAQGATLRRNFRVPVTFESFVYPPTGGRGSMRSIDLSSGGLAFRSPWTFAVGDQFEVVIPITSDGPLLLRAELLRVHLEPGAQNFYACKFLDLIDDEEAMLRETVFAIQIDAARSGKL